MRGAGDIRRVRMFSSRTGEKIDMIYWVEGDYIKDAVDEIYHFMRDWRTDQVKKIDLRTIDIMAAAHNLLDVSEPYMLLSGYRSPQTNAAMRRNRSGVARNSYHTRAMAIDIRVQDRSVNQIARAAEAIGGGGVGRCSRSAFVHVDSGPLRTWGR